MGIIQTSSKVQPTTKSLSPHSSSSQSVAVVSQDSSTKKTASITKPKAVIVDPHEFLKSRLETCRELISTGSGSSVNWLLYGDFGTGKSHTYSTARLPILIDSFDPGGQKIEPINQLISQGNCLWNNYEAEDWRDPKMFNLWDQTFESMVKSGVFNHVGTYVIDSCTTFLPALMGALLASAGRRATVPQQSDYYYFRETVYDIVKKCSALPCDFIMTAHITKTQDSLSGAIQSAVMVPGQAQQGLPSLFDMVLLSEVEDKENGDPKYIVRTKPSKRLRARARIGGSLLSAIEAPNLMAIRAKAGWPIDNLPPFSA